MHCKSISKLGCKKPLFLIRKTHNLVVLLDLLLPLEPNWKSLRPDVQVLSLFAVEIRYPGTSADKATAREMVKIRQNGDRLFWPILRSM